ncbi:MAG: hypothetical protein M1833_006452 [Piccolia ochrophora]|nr:MAG: hypothetical protein M1833_006452 [Piccolia ochrophora]
MPPASTDLITHSMENDGKKDPKKYWGYLINPDKTATPLLDSFLTGLAKYINAGLEPKNTDCLTPEKLAAFYRAVGGDYDALFLQSPHSTLSFIYQSLGCAHSLQPSSDEFAPPSIPALLPRGFVRWQTIQLLLEPEEHVPYLQEACRKFDILNPTGTLFPKDLPKEAFPLVADEEMIQWHNGVFESLERQAQAEQVASQEPCSTAPGPSDYFADYETFRTSGHHRRRNSDYAATPATPSQGSSPWDSDDVRAQYRTMSNSPRRRSVPSQHHMPQTPANLHPSATYRPPPPFVVDPPANPRARRPSAGSTSTSGSETDYYDDPSDTSSLTTPPRRPRFQTSSYRPPPHHPQFQYADPRAAPSIQISPPQRLTTRLPSAYLSARYSGPPRGNYRGANVRFRNENSVHVFAQPNSAASTPGVETPPPRRLGAGDRERDRHRGSSRSRSRSRSKDRSRSRDKDRDRDRDERDRDRDRDRDRGGRSRPQIRRLVSPMLGVDGRRYPTQGVVWR